MPCTVEVACGGKAEEDGIVIKRKSLSLKVPESGSCLSVADIKEAIMDEADIDEDPDDMVIISSQGDPGKFLTDADMVNDGESLVAALVKEGGVNERMTMTVVSDRAVWIVSGNNWGFHVQPIEETHIDKEVPVPIKLSSPRKWEHKFAVVNRKPTDENYWIAQRFSLDKEDENATLEITHESEDEVKVKVVTYQGGVKCSTLLKPDGVQKVFNKNEVASRKEKLTNALAIGGFVLTLVGTVATLATAGAAAPVAGPVAAAGAAGMSAAAALNK